MTRALWISATVVSFTAALLVVFYWKIGGVIATIPVGNSHGVHSGDLIGVMFGLVGLHSLRRTFE